MIKNNSGTNGSKKTVNQLLRAERLRRHWSQKKLAELVGTTVISVKRWEHAETTPNLYFRQQLTTLFGKSMQELGFGNEPEEQPDANQETTTTTSRWNDDTFAPLLPFPHSQPPLLFGRDTLLQDLSEQLCYHPGSSFACFGLPGIGKTALTIALAHHQRIQQQFCDGLIWISLGQQPQLEESMKQCGRRLGLSEEQMEVCTTLDALARAIHTQIGQQRMLFILDDVWQLRDAVMFRIGGVHCTYLLTTRSPAIAFSFAGEQSIHLAEITEEDSFTLLNQLAPQAIQAFPTETRDLIKLVGGLPIALTLIGHHLQLQALHGQPRRLHTAITQLRQLNEQRMLLAEPQIAPGLPIGATVSLQSVIQMSEHLLSPQAQQALYALSVFPSKPHSFLEMAALAVGNMPLDILDLLVDSGLVESAQPGRYYLHQAIADYARLKQTDMTDERRLVDFVIPFVQRHQSDDDQLERDLPMILQACTSAQEHQMSRELVQIMLPLSAFLERRRLYDLANQWLVAARDAAMTLQDIEHAILFWNTLGRMAEFRSDLAPALQHYTAALELARTHDLPAAIGQCLVLAGGILVDQGDFTQADRYFEEAQLMINALHNLPDLCVLLKQRGEIADNRGQYEQALAWYQQSLAIALQLQNSEIISAIYQNIGVQVDRAGQYEQAEKYYQEAFSYACQIQNPQRQSRQSAILMNQGLLAFHQHQVTQAIALSLESLALARQIGNRIRTSSVLQNLGIFESHCGNNQQAERYLQESMTLAQQMGHHWLICETQGEWAMHYLRNGRLELADQSFQAMLQEARAIAAPFLIAYALFGLAQVSAQQNMDQEALQYARESLRIFTQLGVEQAQQLEQWMQTTFSNA